MVDPDEIPQGQGAQLRGKGQYMMEMDGTEEIPHRDGHRKKPCVDGESMAATVSKVLDDDNLLREIIVRVGYPTTLVRAALVCKRWLGHASNPAFLRHFRELHPPQLLGYYISSKKLGAPQFVPMLPQPPELATVIRHLTSYTFGAHDDGLHVVHCQNGIVSTECYQRTRLTHGLHRPLCPERVMPIVPPFPCVHRDLQRFSAFLSKEGCGDLSYLYVLGTKELGKFMVHVYVLRDSIWRLHLTLATDQLHRMYSGTKAVLVDNRIYMPAAHSGYIIVLDLMASSFSTIQLPQGVTCDYFRTILSPADDASSVYLIHVNEFQLRIWLNKGDNWLLVDDVCLRMLDKTLEGEHSAPLLINQVGDNAEFVFLRMGGCTLYLDVTSKTLRKVREMAEKDGHACDVNPFMMIWPPIFPVPKDDPSRNAP